MDLDLEKITGPWTDEIARALRERTAWAHLGQVEVASSNRGRATLGGFIDRRTVEVAPGQTPAQALAAWRKTPEGRVTDRLVVQANTAFRQRLPPAHREAALGDDWLDELGARGHDIVLLGAGPDLRQVMKAIRTSEHAARVHPCACDQQAGLVSAASSAEAVAASVVAMVSASLGPGGLHVIAVLEVKARLPARTRRIDVRL